MRSKIRPAQVFLLAAVASLLIAQTTAPAPRFTISKETTLVSGPLNSDGTINFVQAINDILSKGVTPENNAAIPLLLATTDKTSRQFYAPTAVALGITLDETSALIPFHNYVSDKEEEEPVSPADLAARDAEFEACQKKPWKAKDHPLLVEWLDHSKPALTLIENACTKDHCFLPWVSKSSPPVFSDAFPPFVMFHQAADVLMARAMLRAGNGELADALVDIKRIRQLARLCAQQHTAIEMLIAVAIETRALRGYEALATTANLPEPDLQTLRTQINSLPPLDPLSETAEVERLLSLDIVMMCIRGDYQHLFRGAGVFFFSDTAVDPGDLPKIDGDAMLKAVQRDDTENERVNALPFDDRMKAAVDPQNSPPSALDEIDEQKRIDAAEKFVKLRPGESLDDFTARIARWLVIGSPDFNTRVYKLIARGYLERDIALLTLSLAQYHRVHSQYPESLTSLGAPILHDPFANAPITYRRQANGYILYSLGINQKDDAGQGDDYAVRADH